MYVVAYDIVNDRSRDRIARICQDHGKRIQRSVFECDISAPRAGDLVDRLKKELDAESDRICVYHLCKTCMAQTVTLGEVEPRARPDRAWVI
ncbi:MAG: CRISPR-associated endonuclease Cas2 [Acidobacteriota bacterium]